MKMPGAIPSLESKGRVRLTKKKKCFAIGCPNVEFDTDKSFIYVPEEKIRRLKWFLAVGYKKSHHKRVFLCEDHFDVNKDLFYVDGRVKVKKEVIPKTWTPPSMKEADVRSPHLRSRRKKCTRKENVKPESAHQWASPQLGKELYVLLTRLSSQEIEEATASRPTDSTEDTEMEAHWESRELPSENSAPKSPLQAKTEALSSDSESREYPHKTSAPKSPPRAGTETPSSDSESRGLRPDTSTPQSSPQAETASEASIIKSESDTVIALHQITDTVPVKRKLMSLRSSSVNQIGSPPKKKPRVINYGMESHYEEITIAIHPEFATLSDKFSSSKTPQCTVASPGNHDEPKIDPCSSSRVSTNDFFESGEIHTVQSGVTESPGDAEDTLGLYSGVLSSFKPVKVRIVEVEDLMARYSNYEPTSPPHNKSQDAMTSVEDGSSELPMDIAIDVTSVKLEPGYEPDIEAGKPVESATSISGRLRGKRMQNGGQACPPVEEGLTKSSAVSAKTKPRSVSANAGVPQSKALVEINEREGPSEILEGKVSEVCKGKTKCVPRRTSEIAAKVMKRRNLYESEKFTKEQGKSPNVTQGASKTVGTRKQSMKETNAEDRTPEPGCHLVTQVVKTEDPPTAAALKPKVLNGSKVMKNRKLSALGMVAKDQAKSLELTQGAAKTVGCRQHSMKEPHSNDQTPKAGGCQLTSQVVKTEDSLTAAALKPEVTGSPPLRSPIRRRISALARTMCACCVNSETATREPSPVKSLGTGKSGLGMAKVGKARVEPKALGPSKSPHQNKRLFRPKSPSVSKPPSPLEEQPNKYMCHHCGDSFPTKTRLEIHLALHAPNFTCGQDAPHNGKEKVTIKNDIAALIPIIEAHSRKISRPQCNDPFEDPPAVAKPGQPWHHRKWSTESTLLPVFPFLGSPYAQAPEGRHPLDYFFHFFTPNFLQRTVATTNANIRALKKKLAVIRVTGMDEITLSELLKFVSLTFLHFVYLGGTVDWLGAYGIPVDTILPRDRFDLILQVLSFSMVDSPDIVDRMAPLVEYFNARMTEVSYPTKNLVVDESARVGDDLYYWNSSNNLKYHSSLYTLGEKDGFVQRLCLYRGKKNGVGNPVMNHLMNGLYEKGHSLYMNKFLCSIQLIEELAGRRTYCTGALGPERKIYPTDVAPKANGVQNVTRYSKQGICFSRYNSGREYVCVSSEFNGNESKNKDLWTGRYLLRPVLLQHYLCTTTRPPRKNEPPRPKLTLLKGSCASKLTCHIFALMMRNAFVLFSRQNRTELNVKDFQWEVVKHLISYPVPVQLSDELSSHLPHPIRVDIGSSGQQPRVMCSTCRSIKSNVFCFKCPAQPNMCSECYKKVHETIEVETKS